MPLDPQAAALLQQLEELGGPALHELTPAEARKAMAAMVEVRGNPEPVAEIRDEAVPGPGGEIPVRVYTPQGEGPFPALVYYHGGGWVIGDRDMVEPACTRLANRAGAVVVSVDYRLAPEHKFPAAVIDAFAAAQWVADNAADLGIDPARVGVGGDSAGGNLAAVTAILARDSGGPELAFQLLIYPATDYSFDTPSHRENGEGYLLTTETMRWFWDHYLGSEAEGTDVRASPLRVADASRLPPAFVLTAEFDPLRDEGEAFAERLHEAGNPVTLRRYDGQIHGFVTSLGAMEAGEHAIDDAAAVMRATLGR